MDTLAGRTAMHPRERSPERAATLATLVRDALAYERNLIPVAHLFRLMAGLHSVYLAMSRHRSFTSVRQLTSDTILRYIGYLLRYSPGPTLPSPVAPGFGAQNTSCIVSQTLTFGTCCQFQLHVTVKSCAHTKSKLTLVSRTCYT